MTRDGVAFWPIEGRERSSGASLGVLQTVRLIDDEDGPRKIVKKCYGAPRSVE